MTPKQGLAFVRRHGIVLQAARGPVPSLAEAVAGGRIRGSWWGHAKGHEIFRVAGRYTAVVDGTTTTLLTTWPVRPTLRLGLAFGR